MSTAAVKKTKAPATHPKYIDMITTAIAGLKERTGCSRQAILKYIVANNKVEEGKAVVQVRLALKAGLAKVPSKDPSYMTVIFTLRTMHDIMVILLLFIIVATV